MTEKLLPCPFCGEEAELVTGPVQGLWGVICYACSTHMDDRAEMKEEAEKTWNTRSLPAALDVVLTEVEADRRDVLSWSYCETAEEGVHAPITKEHVLAILRALRTEAGEDNG